MSPQNPQDRQHTENVERLARLEVEVKHNSVDIAELKLAVKTAILEMKQESAENLTAFKKEVQPVVEAFQKAKGVRAAAVVVLVIVFAILGATGREIGGLLLGHIKP